MTNNELTAHAVILAGGRGTRFWPRSRTRTPKQLLNIVGTDTMLQQTVTRLKPLISAERTWTVTSAEQAAAVRKQLPTAARKRVLIEPMGMNTAVAIGLAAIHVRHARRGDALMAVLPADHHIEQSEKYQDIVSAALDVAREPGRMVVLGIPPTRPETGFGYVERMERLSGFRRSAFHRETQTRACAGIHHFWELSLERRDVFLARLHVSQESEKFSAEDTRRARKACRIHRHARLRAAASHHLS